MDGPRLSGSGLHPWHELVEHYTPDGTLGRLLLAAVAGSVGGTALTLTIWVVAVALPFWPILALAMAGGGLAAVGLSLVALWPVYLSLIGNVESPSAYPEGRTSRARDFARDADSAGDSDDAVAVLKRRYASGEISKDEFERRLDDLLGLDAALDSSRRSTDRLGRTREPERN
ncbi:SHOCT domain-containing protein [Halorussus litoreus]|uniref:SHOCT domain-containing protein n=1 Tax=Halorussus litoreus TaxID=1710536 RepID=UPI000E23EA83|nr:SHOCT domain-containing protein [Halorussus litoreus]